MHKQAEHIISLNKLTCGYHGSKNLVSDVNAGVRKGEMVALIGKNGSGKSTLLRTIAALKKPSGGTVTVDNQVNSMIPPYKFARLLSFVESGSSPIENLTVYELVSLGRHPYTNWWGRIKGEDHNKIMEAIGFVGMEVFRDAPVNRLSDGERQRVMIARALAQETSILLLDEPTAFLDLPNKFEIISVLYQLREAGKSILYSTHDLETAFLFADKCWVINDRKIIEGGVEDLGKQQVFTKLFKDSRVLFDEKEMKFIPKRPVKAEIYLKVNDSSSIQWTARALERISYQIVSEKKDAIAEVIVQEQDKETTWVVKFKENTSVFNSLYDMARYLSQINQ